MQNWTPEMWQAALIGLIIGWVLAYVLLRLTKDSVKKQIKTEAELQQVQTELNNQKQQLEKHFAESADLLKTLAQDYQKLYRHLATSSTQFLPELTNNPLFEQNLISAESSEKTENNTEKTEEDIKAEKDAPRDYSEGSSGILKAER
jgi:Uncharacterized protein conserved in bacteria